MNDICIPALINETVVLSMHATCVTERDVFKITSARHFKKEWTAKHSLWLGDINNVQRVLVPVVCSRRLRWMDAITGTLYTSEGRCLSATERTLNVNTLMYDQLMGESILIGATTLEGGK